MSQGIPLNPDDPPDVTKQNQFQEIPRKRRSPTKTSKLYKGPLQSRNGYQDELCTEDRTSLYTCSALKECLKNKTHLRPGQARHSPREGQGDPGESQGAPREPMGSGSLLGPCRIINAV